MITDSKWVPGLPTPTAVEGCVFPLLIFKSLNEAAYFVLDVSIEVRKALNAQRPAQPLPVECEVLPTRHSIATRTPLLSFVQGTNIS